MSGHSKWAGIKHKKKKLDAKHGELFTKLASAITVVQAVHTNCDASAEALERAAAA